METGHLEGMLAVEMMTIASNRHQIPLSAEVVTPLSFENELHLGRLSRRHCHEIVADIQKDKILSTPVSPFVFYRDRSLHVRPCPVITSGDPELELWRTRKVHALQALRVKYPHQLEGLVIGDSNGPLVLAWQLCASTANSAPVALGANTILERKALNPRAPSFRPLRQAFETLGRPRHRNRQGNDDPRAAASTNTNESRSPSHQTLGTSCRTTQGSHRPSSAWSPDFPKVASSPLTSHADEASTRPSFPFRSYGSLLHVNRNVPDNELRDEITARQQELEHLAQVVPRPTDHMSNLKQRISRLYQALETREHERQQTEQRVL